MDTSLTILFVLPLLVIFSYLFDAFARKTKFPSVILLMLTGITLRAVTSYYGFDNLAFLDDLMPVLGVVGLILIVLEGALELEIRKDKFPVIIKGFLAAFIILILNILGLVWLFTAILDMDTNTAVIYAVPLSIISSAVAIPSASGLLKLDKEFVIYESTFSDILGIMIFNYSILQIKSNQPLIGVKPVIFLGLQIVGVIVISLVITYLLFRLLQNIDHKVKFFLILALLVLVYAIGKLFHLPTLVTIFIFGIFLHNAQTLLPDFLQRYLDLNQTEKGLNEFHVLTAESTFIVRTFFFLFFGFSISLNHFTSTSPVQVGLMVLVVMLAIRYLYLAISTLKLRTSPLVYMSPRGLISILLFLQIKNINNISTDVPIDKQTLLIVILGSMLIMIFGTMKKNKTTPEDESKVKLKADADESNSNETMTESNS